MTNEYEGFTKQFLIDRLAALQKESDDMYRRGLEISGEIYGITKLLLELLK